MSGSSADPPGGAEGSTTPAGRIAALEAELDRLRLDLDTARHALHESRSRYRLIVNSIVDYAIIATDLTGRITLWTESAATLFGWPEQRMLGASIEEIFTEADILVKEPQKAMRAALASGMSRHERWHRRADGMHFFASGEVMILRDDDDALAGFLHILRDRTRERRVQHELEASRERLEFALSSSALVGTWDWDVVNNLVYADDKFQAFFGLPPRLAGEPLPIENFLAGIHPEDRDVALDKIDRALAGGQSFKHEYRTIDRDGVVRWVSAQGRCFKDAFGKPVRFPGAVIDITREKQREARQAALLRLTDDNAHFGEPVDYTTRSLQIMGETLVLGQVGYAIIADDGASYSILEQWTDGQSPALAGNGPIGRLEKDLLARLQRDGVLVVEDISLHPATRENAEAWRRLNVESLVGMAVVEQGKVRILLFLFCATPRQWEDDELAFIRDILNRSWIFSRRRQAEQAMIEVETRLRLAQEAADLGTFDYRPLEGAFHLDPRCMAILGLAEGAPATFEQDFLGVIVDDDRAGVTAALAHALQSSTETVFETMFRTLGRVDGAIRHVRVDAQTVVDQGRPVRIVGAVRDVTEERTAAERQAQLTRELRHRVKNTLAMVSALANLTLRRAATPQAGLEAFSARLTALSQAHEILTQTSWTSAPIQGVVARSIAGHPATAEGRIETGGPDVRLSARQSLALSLGLHELLSNATRFGSLSAPGGRVDLHWSVTMAAGAPHLKMTWRETGGPSISPPARFGLGLKLLRQSLPIEIGGTVELSFPPGGVFCHIDAPIHLDEAAEE